jgi:hypothetical protein
MKRKLIGFFIFNCLTMLFILTVNHVFAQSIESEAKIGNMIKSVRSFYQIRERTLDERGTEKDVLQLLEMMADDIVYEHPAANAKLTKEQVRGGMMAHLKEGKNAAFSLLNLKEGKNFVMVELSLQYEVEGKLIKRRGVSIFEFAKNKIQRVAEY